MEKVASAIIYNPSWDILLVDKPKSEWSIITILPWWKVATWENVEQWLWRELREELGILPHQALGTQQFTTFTWASPSSRVIREIIVFKINSLLEWTQFINKNEIENPRYVRVEDIDTIGTITELTKRAIKLVETK